jgi:hypothetical protein
MNLNRSLVSYVDFKIKNSNGHVVQSKERSMKTSKKKWGWSEISKKSSLRIRKLSSSALDTLT